MTQKKATLTLHDGSKYEGLSFGADIGVSGEIAFTTGMTGYPESLTDPSYAGQILIFTYPLIGNYGVPKNDTWESGKIQVKALIVASYNETPSHSSSREPLETWLKNENITAIQVQDTRALTQKIRDQGCMLGTITFGASTLPMHDPNTDNLVSDVSTKNIFTAGNGKKKILLIDCGAKRNISRILLQKDTTVITVPYDTDPFLQGLDFDGILVSNGPGDPKLVSKTIGVVQKAMNKKVPILGICLGNQILALAGGGDTYKLKFGHRGQNQPCILENSKRCYLTTQNHGFAVGKIPKGFLSWFTNANDNTNEGIISAKSPFMSVQFHPEACPGPIDTTWIFDKFLDLV